MPDQNLKHEIPTTGQGATVRAGGWILALVVVAAWIGAGRLWRHSAPEQPIIEAQYSVDINRASERDLLNLPEVGPSLARKILSYREQHGDFQSLADFGEVPGVGPQTLKQLAPFLNFEPQSDTEGINEDTILTAQRRERITP